MNKRNIVLGAFLFSVAISAQAGASVSSINPISVNVRPLTMSIDHAVHFDYQYHNGKYIIGDHNDVKAKQIPQITTINVPAADLAITNITFGNSDIGNIYNIEPNCKTIDLLKWEQERELKGGKIYLDLHFDYEKRNVGCVMSIQPN